MVVYSTYRFVTWAWDQYFNDQKGRNKEEDEEEEEEIVLQNHTTAVGIHSSYDTHDACGVDGRWVITPTEELNQHATTPGSGETNRVGDSAFRWRIRRQRMIRCRDETLKALDGFLPSLRSIVDERTSTREETQQLKQLRTERLGTVTKAEGEGGVVPTEWQRLQEQKLWNVIQIRLITKMMATAYAHTMLLLVLTIQVNLLGGRLLEEQLINRPQSNASQTSSQASLASARMDSYQASHRLVLVHTYEYFFQVGLINLIQTVERAVTEIIANDWNVLDRTSLHLSYDQMEDKLNVIRSAVEKENLMSFLIPQSSTGTSAEAAVNDELARKIIHETWDLIESPFMLDALKDCLVFTFETMRDKYWGTLFASPESEDITAKRYITRPLATVIPQLKHSSNSFYRQPSNVSVTNTATESDVVAPNEYCAPLQSLPTVLELSDVSFN